MEKTPLAVLEAQLAELPVVAADVGGVADAVLSGQTGILVPPDDPHALAVALESLLSNTTGEQGSAAGRDGSASSHASPRATWQLERLYAEIVA